MPDRIAYLQLNTDPEPAPDAAILVTLGFASSLGCGLHVPTFAMDLPQVASLLGDVLIELNSP